MIETLVYVACAAGIALPTIPGLLQLRRPRKDTTPVDQNYKRDPRYMGQSFRKTILPIVETNAERVPFLQRQNEYARITDDVTLQPESNVTDVILAKGRVSAGRRCALLDVYARGGAAIGEQSALRCIAADADVTLGDHVSVLRWIDVDGNAQIGRHCDLGTSASATGTLSIRTGTRFRRMHASPVSVMRGTGAPAAPAQMAWRGSCLVIKDGEVVEGDVIAPRDVVIGDRAAISGTITCGGDISIGSAARISGNIIARGDVSIGAGCTIGGHIFSDRTIVIGADTTVARADAMKTVQSTESLHLSPGVNIYGWVICERGGTTIGIGA